MGYREVDLNQNATSQRHDVDIDIYDRIEDMIHYIGEDYFRKPICMILYVVTMMCHYIRGAQILYDCL